jgi:hypothetical protein
MKPEFSAYTGRTMAAYEHGGRPERDSSQKGYQPTCTTSATSSFNCCTKSSSGEERLSKVSIELRAEQGTERENYKLRNPAAGWAACKCFSGLQVYCYASG